MFGKPSGIIFIIIIAGTVLFSLKGFSDQQFFNKYKLNPYMVRQRGEYVRLLTHGFLHGDYIHLIMNMFVFYVFGENLETYFTLDWTYGPVWGSILFIVLYLGGMLAATIPALVKHGDNIHYNSIGASGAVAAILFAFIMLLPTAPLRLMFIPVDIPAWLLGILYLLFESVMNRRGGTNIAHDAHIGGAVFGILFMIILDYEVIFRFKDAITSTFSG